MAAEEGLKRAQKFFYKQDLCKEALHIRSFDVEQRNMLDVVLSIIMKSVSPQQVNYVIRKVITKGA